MMRNEFWSYGLDHTGVMAYVSLILFLSRLYWLMWSFLRCLYCLLTGKYYQQRVGTIERDTSSWMKPYLESMFYQSDEALHTQNTRSGSTACNVGTTKHPENGLHKDSIKESLVQNKAMYTRRNRYNLSKSQNIALNHILFWEELFDGLRAFDDDCSSIFNDLILDKEQITQMNRLPWRQQLSVTFCRYYRNRIFNLLVSMECEKQWDDGTSNIHQFSHLHNQLCILKNFLDNSWQRIQIFNRDYSISNPCKFGLFETLLLWYSNEDKYKQWY